MISGTNFTAEWMSERMKAIGYEGATFSEPKLLGGKDGMLGNIYFVEMKTSDPDICEKLVFKVNTDRQEYAELVSNLGLAKTEIKTYSIIIDQLLRYERDHGLGRLRSLVPKFYTSHLDVEKFIIVLENVSGSFEMRSLKDQGLDPENVKLCADAAAVYHATSYCYVNSQKSTVSKLWGDCLFNFNDLVSADFMVAEVNNAIDLMVESIKQGNFNNFVDQQDISKIRNFQKNFMKISEEVTAKDGAATILLHGDFWTNNIMINKDGSSCKIIDFQFSTDQVGVAMDLATLFLISCSPEINDRHIESFFEVYYQSFSKTCKSYGIRGPWKDYKDFRNDEVDPKINLFGLIWCIESYEVLTNIRNMEERIYYVLGRCLKSNPEAFEEEYKHRT